MIRLLRLGTRIVFSISGGQANLDSRVEPHLIPRGSVHTKGFPCLFVCEELDSSTLTTNVQVKREHIFAYLCPLTEQELPSTTAAADAKRDVHYDFHVDVTS